MSPICGRRISKKSFDGNLWIITKRVKTNTDVNVPLLDIPKMILKKYKGKLPDGKILPVISNQKLNAYLKEIADICGIKKEPDIPPCPAHVRHDHHAVKGRTH